MIDVVLVDDHLFVRAGIRRILEKTSDIRVVAEFSDGLQFLRTGPDPGPYDVVLLDTTMPNADGVKLFLQTRSWRDPPQVILMSNDAGRERALEALAAGAQGFITKDADADRVVAAIRSVYAGGLYFTSSGSGSLMSDTVASSPGHVSPDADPDDRAGDTVRLHLSPAEMLILSGVRSGATSADLAADLDVNTGRVVALRRQVTRKLLHFARMVSGDDATVSHRVEADSTSSTPGH